MPAQLTISEQTRPAPYRRPWRLNAWTLTPAIGARTRRVGTSTGPIFHAVRRSIIAPGMVVPGLLTLVQRGSYHSEPLTGPTAPQSRLWRRFREGSDPHSRGLQTAQERARPAAHGKAARDRGADRRCTRVRRDRRERGVRRREERADDARAPHLAARGTPRERTRDRRQEGRHERRLDRVRRSPARRGCQGDDRVLHCRLGRGKPGGAQALERV